MMKKVITLLMLIALGSNLLVHAQLISGNAFIRGNFVEAGINPCGNLGSTIDAPPGYHPRSGTSGSGGANLLGFVADPDMDGWDVDLDGVGGNYHGDYFMPATPRIGWGIQFNGVSYGNERSHSSGCGILGGSSAIFAGSVQSVTTSPDGDMTAMWMGTNAGVQVKKEFSVTANKTYFTVKVTVSNTSASTVNNIYYGEYVNPDHGFFYNDLRLSGVSTINSISLQNPMNNAALVSSIFVRNGDTVYLGLGTLDCRARVIRSTGASVEPTGVIRSWYDGNSFISMNGYDSISANRAIGIAYRIGSLPPAGTTSFTYAYILNKHHLNEALEESDPVIVVNGQMYSNGDTAYVCSGNVSLAIGNAGNSDTWNWIADSPVLSVSTGVSSTAVLASGNVVAINASAVTSCGTKSANIVVMSAERFYVNGAVSNSGNGFSWNSPFKTLSEALKKLNTSDCTAEIWVAQGTYYPQYDVINLNRNPSNPRDATFRLINNVKIYGGFTGTETLLSQRNWTAHPTILSGDIGVLNDSTDNVYHVVMSIGNVGTAELNGLTITKGYANGTSELEFLYPRYTGSGIYIRDGAPLIKNCIITRNTTQGYSGGSVIKGGAIAYIDCDTAVLDSVQVVYNRTLPRIIGALTSSCSGAGIAVERSHLKITNSHISNNTNTGGSGGGIYFLGSRNLTMENVYIERNTASYSGGMYFGNNIETMNVSVKNSYIRGNSSARDFGGFNISSDWLGLGTINFNIDNCLITGNRASESIGAGKLEGNVRIGNTTIAVNRAGLTPGGIRIVSGTINMHNSILWGNTSAGTPNFQVSGGTFNAQYSTIQNATVYSGTGNSNQNPLFVSPMTAASTPTIAGDYSLQACSPAINAGNNAVIPTGIITDIAGNPRVHEATVDMGAYENQGANLPSQIITEPANQIACTGATAVFGLVADHVSSYQWQYNTGSGFINLTDNSTYSGTTTDTLTITNVIAAMSGHQFRCVAIGNCLPDTSSAVMLNFSEVNITTEPVNRFICPEQNTTFSVTAVNAATYQWQYNTGSGFVNIPENSTYSGTASSELNITFATASMNGYLFRCIVADACPRYDTSVIATLSVIHIRYVRVGGSGNQSGSSWSNASGDLQLMINQACPNTEIWVSEGTYRPSRHASFLNTITYGSRNNAFVLKSNVKIFGGFAPTGMPDMSQRDWVAYPTILSGDIGIAGNSSDNCYHVVISSGEVGTAELNGFTVTAGNAAGSYANIYVNGNVFYNYNGGGMYNYNSSPTIANVIFTGNTAIDYGGGMNNVFSSPTLTNVMFSGNIAEQGGGMRNNSDSPSISNTTFSGNRAVSGGGMFNDNASSPTLTNAIFSGNRADYGGGMYNFSFSSLTLTNVIFSGNSAFTGGGMFMGTSSSPILTNTTFSGNRAVTGGGIYNYASLVIRNSIIWGNSSGIIGGGTSTTTHSIVQDGHTGTGNLDTDPFFVHAPSHTTAPFATGDYRLTPCSPAINAGDNAVIPTGIITDIAGNHRVREATVDMGAYENSGFTLHHLANTTLASNGDCMTADGWRHYYHNDGTENKIFISIHPDGQNLGTVTASTRLNEHYGDSSRILVDPYLQVPFHIPLNRSWILNASNTFSNPVGVRFYFADRDSMDLVKTIPVDSLKELIVYKVNGNNIWDINSTGYKRHMPGEIADTATYIYGRYQDIRYAEFQVKEFSTGTIGFMDNVLPLDLLSFTGTVIEGKVFLQWHTVNEQDVSHFGIERSLDARKWETLNIISARNGMEQVYDDWDDNPHKGINYYRLKMTDYDGSYKYSRMVEVDFWEKDNAGVPQYNIYPNPNNGQFYVGVKDLSKEETHLFLFDGLGRLVHNQQLHGGVNTVNAKNLVSGMYYLKIESQQNSSSYKVVVD